MGFVERLLWSLAWADAARGNPLGAVRPAVSSSLSRPRAPDDLVLRSQCSPQAEQHGSSQRLRRK
jgi:hypothetical protein